MTIQTTLIDQPVIRLVTAKSARFPELNGQAFEAIESKLDTLRGRKFYGLVYETEQGIVYHAGLVPQDVAEEQLFTASGFPITQIEAGRWARVKLLDWSGQTERIGPMFGEMIQAYGIDPARPQLEFYRSQRELHLLLPVPNSEA